MAEMLRSLSILLIVSAALASAVALNAAITGSTVWSPTGGTARLISWDDTDSYAGGPMTKYTYPSASVLHPQCLSEKVTPSYYRNAPPACSLKLFRSPIHLMQWFREGFIIENAWPGMKLSQIW